MKLVKRLLYIVLFLIAVAIIVPFFIPLNRYIPKVEALVAEKIHEPVRIRALRLSVLPVPSLNIEGISLGELPDIQIEKIIVAVDPFSLFKQVKVINSINLEQILIHQDMLVKIPAWAGSGDTGPQQVSVRKIGFKQLTFVLKDKPIGPYEGQVKLALNGGLEQVVINSEDARLRAVITPQSESFRIDLHAKDWTLPAGPSLLFESLNVQAWANATQLDASQINGRLYGGDIKGAALLNWSKGWKLTGQMKSAHVELKQLVPVFSKEARLSGKLNADASFRMKGASAGQLVDTPDVDAKFKVNDGVLHNVDLVSAVKSIASKGGEGGQTRFDELSGELHLAGKAYHFKRVKISSGLFAANGDVDIARNKQLSGRVIVKMNGTASLIAVPLNVSGTLKDPVLLPSKGALAGAVAGTAVLGPGVGTSLGMKASGWAENLFK